MSGLGFNTLSEWGDYAQGRRIEVEQGFWTAGEALGLPETDNRTRETPDRFFLTQRAVESPHPLTWHSRSFASARHANEARTWKLFIEAAPDSPAQKLCIPGVSEIAFDKHHGSVCSSKGSVLHCENNHQCIEDAITLVTQLRADVRLLRSMLP